MIADNSISDAQAGAVVVTAAEGAGGHAISGNVMRRSVYGGQGGIALGDSRGCTVVGNVFQALSTLPTISAGPGGGAHLIASNNILGAGEDAIAIYDAVGCLVSGNRVSG